MNKEIAMKWADELESGKYAQGHFKLKRGLAFCCLGVLTEMLDPQHSSLDDNIQGDLSNDIRRKAEMFDGIGSTIDQSIVYKPKNMPPCCEKNCLAYANDAGMTFPEIASYIRQNWEKL